MIPPPFLKHAYSCPILPPPKIKNKNKSVMILYCIPSEVNHQFDGIPLPTPFPSDSNFITKDMEQVTSLKKITSVISAEAKYRGCHSAPNPYPPCLDDMSFQYLILLWFPLVVSQSKF